MGHLGSTVLFALTRGAAGREDEFEDWYQTQHLVDVTKFDGVHDGQRYKLADAFAGTFPADTLAFYTLEPDNGIARFGAAAAKAVAGNAEAAKTGAVPPMRMTDSIDGGKTETFMCEAATEELWNPAADKGAKAVSLFAALTNALPGQEAVFAKWYDAVHIQEVVAIPGFLSARRYHTKGGVDGKPSTHASLALYTCSVSPEEAKKALLAAAPKFTMENAGIDGAATRASWWVPTGGPKVTKGESD
ncbi:hypothetical protein DFJ74DRAFT_709949 [Hyaloraphidium curvatum]|nr:hypothetical protein DFJ74DRAFT_709949 [Hyaloraphidium curvatum]